MRKQRPASYCRKSLSWEDEFCKLGRHWVWNISAILVHGEQAQNVGNLLGFTESELSHIDDNAKTIYDNFPIPNKSEDDGTSLMLVITTFLTLQQWSKRQGTLRELKSNLQILGTSETLEKVLRCLQKAITGEFNIEVIQCNGFGHQVDEFTIVCDKNSTLEDAFADFFDKNGFDKSQVQIIEPKLEKLDNKPASWNHECKLIENLKMVIQVQEVGNTRWFCTPVENKNVHSKVRETATPGRELMPFKNEVVSSEHCQCCRKKAMEHQHVKKIFITKNFVINQSIINGPCQVGTLNGPCQIGDHNEMFVPNDPLLGLEPEDIRQLSYGGNGLNFIAEQNYPALSNTEQNAVSSSDDEGGGDVFLPPPLQNQPTIGQNHPLPQNVDEDGLHSLTNQNSNAPLQHDWSQCGYPGRGNSLRMRNQVPIPNKLPENMLGCWDKASFHKMKLEILEKMRNRDGRYIIYIYDDMVIMVEVTYMNKFHSYTILYDSEDGYYFHIMEGQHRRAFASKTLQDLIKYYVENSVRLPKTSSSSVDITSDGYTNLLRCSPGVEECDDTYLTAASPSLPMARPRRPSSFITLKQPIYERGAKDRPTSYGSFHHGNVVQKPRRPAPPPPLVRSKSPRVWLLYDRGH